MPFSYNEIPGAKSPGDTISVPFPFISRDHVFVLVDGQQVSQTFYSWANDGVLECLGGFPSGSSTRVERRTPVGNLETLQKGAGTFDFKGVNLNDTQLLYIQQENADVDLGWDGRISIVEDRIGDLDGAIEEAQGFANDASQSADDAAESATTLQAAIHAIQNTNHFYDYGSINDLPGENYDYGGLL